MAHAETQSRPSATELNTLTEACRRAPGSPAFVSLGEALIALGRPGDAIEIGARGLRVSPQNLRGRMMVAHAFVLLHRWKEAQAELLKVVKSDRNNGPAFCMLGEVLLRRGDFERAMPVLQHAHNLSPADPSILELLRRARSRQSPPPPLPTPQPIAPLLDGPPPRSRASNEFEELPTRVADEAYTDQVARSLRANDGRKTNAAALARVELDRIERQAVSTPVVSEVVRQSDNRGADRALARPVEMHRPPPAENPLAPMSSSPPTAPTSRPSAPGVSASGLSASGVSASGVPLVRPRVVSARRTGQAAHESLRRSAAVGEAYLSNLLAAGLLDVPNVRVSEMAFDVNPDRRWGRSSMRMFIYLFVITATVIAGVSGWYWYTEKQRGTDVARHLQEAETLSKSGAYSELDQGLAELRSALKRDPSSLIAIARYAEAAGLNTLLYGEIPPAEVSRAVAVIASDTDNSSDPGYQEALIAKTTVVLATLHQEESRDVAVATLAKTIEDLRASLERSPDSPRASKLRWLEGRGLLAAGDRNGARGAFAQAWNEGAGEILAGIEIGDMLLDEGKSDDAMKHYNAVLEKVPAHPLALLGRALLRAEESRDVGEMMRDVNVGLANVEGVRAQAYRALAEANAQQVLEDYDEVKTSLTDAVDVVEPRFLARVALGHLRLGNLATAAELREQIRWYSDTVIVNPLVKQVDAELLWHAGKNAAALEAVKDDSSTRASSIRGRALFAMGAYPKARQLFEQGLERAPDDLTLQVWAQANRLVSRRGEYRKANQELERLGLGSTSKGPRTIHGIALALVGKKKQARTTLEASIEDVSDENPNPLEYRAHVVLARLDLARGAIGNASSHLNRALELNPDFLGAHDLLGQLLARTDKAEARRHLDLVVSAGALSANGEIVYAQLLAPLKAKDRKTAAAAFKRALSKGAAIDKVREAVTQLDPSLFDAVGIEPKVSRKGKSKR